VGERICARPGFGRRPPAEILVRPHVVVEEAELAKRAVERIQRVDSELVELALERAEEALGAAVGEGKGTKTMSPKL
jgi:hypothetical protein